MSRMSLTLLSVFMTLPQTAKATDPVVPAGDLKARYAALTGVGAATCRQSERLGDIVVCGMRRENDRQRLPFADVRSDGDDNVIVKGEIRSASADRVRVGSCYAVPGQICGQSVRIVTMRGGKFDLGSNGESTAPVALRILGYALSPHQAGPELPKPRN